MNALFHGDLLNFGTIVILVMIIGGGVVALTIFAESAWMIRDRRKDREGDVPAALARPDEQNLPKSA